MRKTHTEQETKLLAVKHYRENNDSMEKVAQIFGVVKSTISEWVNGIKKNKTLKRRNNPSSGRQMKVLESDFNQIKKILKEPASNFGFETDFWTIPRMIIVFKKELNLKVSASSIRRTMKKIKYSYQKPERRYYHKNKKANTKEWQEVTVPAIKECIKKYKAVLYFKDEASVSLTPSIAKTWGPIGKKIYREVSPNKGSISIISAINKNGNLLFNLYDHGKRFKGADIVNFLKELLNHHRNRHVIVVMDQAPCHKAKVVKDFIESQKRLHVFYIPPRTPEFNPEECVWDYLKNKSLKEHKAKTTKDLKNLARSKMRKIASNRKLVRNIFKQSEGANFFL